jgi:hypothetical protein
MLLALDRMGATHTASPEEIATIDEALTQARGEFAATPK